MPSLMICSKFAYKVNAALRSNFCRIWFIRFDEAIIRLHKASLGDCNGENKDTTRIPSLRANDWQNLNQTQQLNYDIETLIKPRKTYSKHPIVEYVNINSIRTKISHLREIINKAPTDIRCVDERKLESSFPDAQFQINNYQVQERQRQQRRW